MRKKQKKNIQVCFGEAETYCKSLHLYSVESSNASPLSLHHDGGVKVHKRCTENQNRLSFDIVEQTRISPNYIIQPIPSLS